MRRRVRAARPLLPWLAWGLLALAPGFAPPPAATALADSAPGVTILAPRDQQTMTANPIIVMVAVQNFQLGLGTAALDRQGGSWRLLVDGQPAGQASSTVIALPNDQMPDLAAGAHTLQAVLHGPDGTPVPGAASTFLTIDVANDLHYAPEAGSPAIAIVSPAPGSTVGPDVIVQVRVTGLKLGAPDGYWQINVDGQPAVTAITTVAEIHGLTPGQHTLTAALYPGAGQAARATAADVPITYQTTIAQKPVPQPQGQSVAFFVVAVALALGLLAGTGVAWRWAQRGA